MQQPQQGLINIDISALKEIYNKAIGSSNGVKTLSNNSTLNFIRTLNVNWDTYTLQKRKDSSIVAEFDMKNDTGLYVLKKLNFGDTIKYKNKTTVTFIKFKDGSRLNFFTKIIEDLTLPGSHSVLNKLHYNQVPYGFTRMILYYTLDRQYINGYRYVNSTIQGTVSLNTTPPITTDKSVNSVKTNEALFCNYSPVYAMVCTSDGGATYSFTCGLTVVGYSGSCTGGGSGGGGSVGGDTGGGGYGGDPTPPNPCSPITYSIRPVAIQSVNNGKRVMVAQPDVGGDDGSGGGSSPCANSNNNFNSKIDSSNLANCFKKALFNLNRIDYNCVGNTVSKFAGETPGFNWKVQDGYAGGNNGQTSPKYNSQTGTVTTIFNSSNFTGGSDLAIAKTILHESVHAYLVAYFRTDYTHASSTYSQLVDDYNTITHQDLNAAQHNEIVRDFIGQIATTLQQYGQLQGYNLDYKFYSDLAWGGLTDTDAFKALSPKDQDRINEVIYSEQNGTDRSGNPIQLKGKPGGC